MQLVVHKSEINDSTFDGNTSFAVRWRPLAVLSTADWFECVTRPAPKPGKPVGSVDVRHGILE